LLLLPQPPECWDHCLGLPPPARAWSSQGDPL
jgi:hypothetical protein